MNKQILAYRAEVEAELHAILDYWTVHALDEKFGGFVGRILDDNTVVENSPKGAVLNSRILWAFSAAYSASNNTGYLALATKAYHYFINNFIDREFGGVFWTLDYSGKPLETKKQVYAIAFAIYGLSEYSLASGTAAARDKAVELYGELTRHSYDEANGGYVEALSREWGPLENLRLSNKDENAPKSMNTHLHVLEAFSNLYKIWPDEKLKQRISDLIQIFLDHIIDVETGHLHLFFNLQFQPQGKLISYGHDIEAAWLLGEAAETISDHRLIETLKKYSLLLSKAALRGLDSDGGIWYEYDQHSNRLIKEKHSWPQAEAMVGFFNAYQITGDSKWLLHSINSWQFIQQYIIDGDHGEWHWGVGANGKPIKGMDKVGIWKCPYHSSRACIEIMKRVTVEKGT